jgi:ABC-type phosphate transport system substrate-binding protein
MPKWIALASLFCAQSLLLAASAEPVRVAAVKSYDELARIWGRAANIETEVQIFDPSMAVRQVAGEKFDFALINSALNQGQKVQIAALPGRIAIETTVGWEAVTLLVHPENPISFLRQSQIAPVLAAPGCKGVTETTTIWKPLVSQKGWGTGALEVLLPPETSSEGEALKSMALGDCAFRQDIQILSSQAAIERAVGSRKNAIGFVSRLRHIPSAKIVPILAAGHVKAATSSAAALSSGDYPLGRRIRLISNQRFPSESTKGRYLSFAISEEGQREAQRFGFVPLR